jgi:hypothetical protein
MPGEFARRRASRDYPRGRVCLQFSGPDSRDGMIEACRFWRALRAAYSNDRLNISDGFGDADQLVAELRGLDHGWADLSQELALSFR